MPPFHLSSGHRADDQQRFLPVDHGAWQKRIRRLVRQVAFAGKIADERAPFPRCTVANCPAQFRKPRFDRFEQRRERCVTGDLDIDFAAAETRERAQVRRQHDLDHASV